MLEKSICFTGHRPDKLGGYNVNCELNKKIINQLGKTIESCIQKGYTNFISGMALGIDMWAATLVLSLKSKYPQITLECAIPCNEQYKVWKDPKAIALWHSIVERADKVTYVSKEPYTPWCMQKRNEYMVDNSTKVIAVWDGTSGGTFSCIKYARNKEREIVYINPNSLREIFNGE